MAMVPIRGEISLETVRVQTLLHVLDGADARTGHLDRTIAREARLWLCRRGIHWARTIAEDGQCRSIYRCTRCGRALG